MDISRIFFVLHALRLSGISRTLQNTMIRDNIERSATSKNSTETSVNPGTLKQYDQIPGGFIIKFENANLEVVYLTKEMIRITWGPGKPSYPYTINQTEWDFADSELTTYNLDSLTLHGNNLQVMIGREGNVIFGDPNAKILKQDNAPIRCGNTWKLSTRLSPEEHIYGLGERASSLNLRPGRYTSWNTDAGGTYTQGSDPLYIGTPMYLSLSPSGSHLVYFENSYRSRFEIDETLDATFSGGELRYYVITGSLHTIYTQLGELIGRPFLPPRWSLGYHQCRWGYHTEEDIRQVIKGFETHDLPISAIHLDIDYMDGFKVFTIDKSRFPDLKNLTTELDHQGIKVVVTINPAVKRDAGFDVYVDGLSKDVYCKLPDGKTMNGVSWPGWSVFPDFTSAETRQWWMGLYKRLFDQGISGIWHDMNEPSSFTAWGDKSIPITTRHAMEGKGGDHSEAHNIYGLLMNQSGYQAFRKHIPEKRPWIFSRSGWAGLQKYAWNWTGDIETSWEALQVTIPMILGLGLSGHVFSGVDIGGFSGTPNAELYQRWFQLGAFLPLFRTHSAVGTDPREPWSFGEPTTRIVRKFAKLRYKLLPYYYTLAWEASQTGLPLLRPVFWNDPENQSFWDIDDEFMLGAGLLIAPIVHPGELSRKVVLPPGLWYSYWDDQQYQGPCQIDIHATPDTIPVFVKGGTVLPTEEENSLAFHVYSGLYGQSVSRLYLDEGDGYGIDRIDTFYMDKQNVNYRITWDSKGDYPLDFLEIKWYFHGSDNDYAHIDGKRVEIVNHELTTQIFNVLEFNIA